MSTDFDFAWKKLNDAIKKQIKTEKDQEDFIKSLRTSSTSVLLQQRQDRIKEKLEDKIDDIDHRTKSKIDYYKSQIEASKKSTERKISVLEAKLKSYTDKIEVEIQSLRDGNESYHNTCLDEIDRLMEKKSKTQERLEKQKDQGVVFTTPAEEKKIAKLEITKESIGKDIEKFEKQFFDTMAQEKEAKQKEVLEEFQREEMKERMKLAEEKERFMKEKEIQKLQEERRKKEKREQNQKTIQELSDKHKVPVEIATIMFQYNRSKAKAIEDYNEQHPDTPFEPEPEEVDEEEVETKKQTFFSNYLNTLDTIHKESEEEQSNKQDNTVYKHILESLNLFDNDEEKQGYLKSLPVIKQNKELPSWFQQRIDPYMKLQPKPKSQYPTIITNSKIVKRIKKSI
jgi:hypothetical protein